MYQHHLEGLEKEWSNWSSKTEKEYTNLTPGDYTFHLRAKKAGSPAFSQTQIDFQIAPLWYANTVAYFIYALIAPLMNISVHGVEISRYRLRKKLHLDSKENLTEFLMNV